MQFHVPRSSHDGLFSLCASLKSGLIVVTGITGSGKQNITNQILRSLLSKSLSTELESGDELERAKPLVIGELRDNDSIRLANRALMEGCLVLTQAHGDSEDDAILELLKRGLDRDLIAPGSMFINCRLLRHVGSVLHTPIPLDFCGYINRDNVEFSDLMARLKRAAKAKGRSIENVLFEGFGTDDVEWVKQAYGYPLSREQIKNEPFFRRRSALLTEECIPESFGKFWTFEVLVAEDMCTECDSSGVAQLYAHRDQALDAVFDGVMCPNEYELQFGEIGAS
ncbi:hypothetical protein RYA05_01235 [Pseudomonas syringae pv. actinidiae]|nr:hypothetical protein [Pseudomonas syringae pv. actinidiae]